MSYETKLNRVTVQNFSEPLLKEEFVLLSLSNLFNHRTFFMESLAKKSPHITYLEK